MQDFNKFKAIGLMSDTSLEGIAAAIITTNGLDVLEIEQNIFRPYDEYLLEQIKTIRGKDYNDFPKKLKKAEYDFTMANLDIVNDLLKFAELSASDIGLIGFHGLTLYHNPEEKATFQLGDPELLASESRLSVVANFRTNDIHNGGGGGPLSPIYLAHLYKKETRPLAILNISGFSNITMISENERLTAGLICPGMAMLNDFMLENFDMPMDYDGAFAAKGTVNQDILSKMLDDDFFKILIPKSIRRGYFNKFFDYVKDIDKQDAIATLTALIASVVVDSIKDFQKVIISGGGLKNPTLMRMIKTNTNAEIISCTDMGIDPRMVEAQAYAYIAVRCQNHLPTSFPETTGALSATIAGTLYLP